MAATPFKRVHALWEPQEHVYLAYPTSQYVSLNKVHGRTLQDIQADVVKVIQHSVKVIYLVNNEKEMYDFDKYLEKCGADLDAIHYLQIPHCDIWLRDIGPIFVEATDVKGRQMLTVPWPGFDNWGHAPYIRNNSWSRCDIPNYLQRDLAEARGYPWMRVLHRVHPNSMGRFEAKSDQTFILEGGSTSFNGGGSMITTQEVVEERNPNLRKRDVDAIFANYYGVGNVIRLPKGLIEDWPLWRGPIRVGDQDKVWTPIVTTGHVDEFCRFVGPRTVLLAEVHGTQDGVIERINRSRLLKAEQVLRESKNERGEPLEIIRIPAAPVQLMEMDTKDPQFTQLQAIRGSKLEHKQSAPVLIAASYVNYLLTNDVVVMPKYHWPGETPDEWEQVDRDAKEVMEQVFPGRTVVQIDNLHINAGGGGFNCSSCNEPLL